MNSQTIIEVGKRVHGDIMVRPNWAPHVPLLGGVGITKSTDGETYTFQFNGGEVQIAVNAQAAKAWHRILGKLLDGPGGTEGSV